MCKFRNWHDKNIQWWKWLDLSEYLASLATKNKPETFLKSFTNGIWMYLKTSELGSVWKCILFHVWGKDFRWITWLEGNATKRKWFLDGKHEFKESESQEKFVDEGAYNCNQEEMRPKDSKSFTLIVLLLEGA